MSDAGFACVGYTARRLNLHFIIIAKAGAMTSNQPDPNRPPSHASTWRGASRAPTDQASLRAHIERSHAARIIAPSASSAQKQTDIWAIPNTVPIAIAASFALTPLFSTLGLIDVLRHYAIGAGVLIGGGVLFALMRGALGAGVIKLAAALSVWIGGGEPLLMFLALSLITPAPLSLAAGFWNRHMRGRTAGEIAVPYWPTMALVFFWIAPGAEAAKALGLRPLL